MSIPSCIFAFPILVAASGCSSTQKITTNPTPLVSSEEDALACVWKLHEITAWCQLLKDSSDSVKPIAYAETSPGDGEGGWTFYVGEDHDTHTAIFGRYFVDAATGEIRRWDGAADGYVPVPSKR